MVLLSVESTVTNQSRYPYIYACCFQIQYWSPRPHNLALSVVEFHFNNDTKTNQYTTSNQTRKFWASISYNAAGEGIPLDPVFPSERLHLFFLSLQNSHAYPLMRCVHGFWFLVWQNSQRFWYPISANYLTVLTIVLTVPSHRSESCVASWVGEFFLDLDCLRLRFRPIFSIGCWSSSVVSFVTSSSPESLCV